ncbi:MAG: tetraacyldisaccharide 4'-kinase [Methylobacteriaceae bacterium]|nr:tetraacyldisaccharide 4'-kinase [Methylobacteriaceae bacterium]
MKAPDFWWRPPSLAAALLGPAAAIYGTVAARRMARPGTRAALPVVCVGNVTVGGAGKTPTAIAVAARLIARGHRPAFLLRGYGGRISGPLAVDRSRHGPEDVGDEALLLARHAPTVVARDRPAGAAFAAQSGADVLVMDDGLQNPSLAKDLALAVFDGARGIGNGRVLPAGPLRAPLAAQWSRIDATLVIGEGAPGEQAVRLARQAGKPVLRGRLEPDRAVADSLAGERVLAVAGIGRPSKFVETLSACGAEVVGVQALPDHYRYGPGDARRLADEAERLGARLVTTEKDAVKLSRLVEAEPRLARLVVLPVTLRVADDAALDALLDEALVRSA